MCCFYCSSNAEVQLLQPNGVFSARRWARREEELRRKEGRKCGLGKERGGAYLPWTTVFTEVQRLPHKAENRVCWQSALAAPVWCYYNSNPLVKTVSAKRLQHLFSFKQARWIICIANLPTPFVSFCATGGREANVLTPAVLVKCLLNIVGFIYCK